MTGLSKITDKILEEARADAAAKLAEAEKEASAISTDYARRAAAIRESIDEQAKKEASEIVSRAKSG